MAQETADGDDEAGKQKYGLQGKRVAKDKNSYVVVFWSCWGSRGCKTLKCGIRTMPFTQFLLQDIPRTEDCFFSHTFFWVSSGILESQMHYGEWQPPNWWKEVGVDHKGVVKEPMKWELQGSQLCHILLWPTRVSWKLEEWSTWFFLLSICHLPLATGPDPVYAV